ncbi:MAG: acyl-CoA ligase (AMP-forming), exosortase A system-associated [Chakrabartia sp.]
MQYPDPNPHPLDHIVLHGAGNSTALVTKVESISFSELDQMVGRFAAALLAAGCVPGDRVATWLNKTVEACIMPLVAARAGLIHVPINPALKRGQVSYILEDSGAKILILGEGRRNSLEDGDVPPSCSIWLEYRATEARLTGASIPISNHDPDDVVAILYTSGSTGKPKGVMLSHANLWLGAVSVAQYLGLKPKDRTLCVLPLSFDYGQNQLLSAWMSGGSAVPLDYLNARDVIRAIDRFNITTLAGVPPLWIQLTEAVWTDEIAAKLRRLTNSGGALTTSLVKKLRSIFPQADLYPMYGLTEAFRSTYLDPSLVDGHPTAIGSAIPFAEIMVVRPDGSEAEAEEAGELVHAGPLVAKGYWQDADRTAQRFRPAPSWSISGGTAVWSGDTVRQSVDGLLYFVGRDDEMIKTSGNRISPCEIEDAAIASGLVSEAVALGIADARLGQAIVLIARGEELKEERLRSYFRSELPAYMQPMHIIWKDTMPRNPNGKLDRVALRQTAAAYTQ